MQNGVDTLICGGIGGGAQAALAEAGIKLYGGVSGDADAAVSALLSGNLGYDPNVHCDHHDHEHGEGWSTPAVTTAAAIIAATDMERTLTQLPFWSSLTEQEQETLRRSAFVRHYERARSYTAATPNVSECCLFFPVKFAPIFFPRKGEKSHCSGCIRANYACFLPPV